MECKVHITEVSMLIAGDERCIDLFYVCWTMLKKDNLNKNMITFLL